MQVQASKSLKMAVLASTPRNVNGGEARMFHNHSQAVTQVLKEGPIVALTAFYSYRSATMGSTFVARRAGM